MKKIVSLAIGVGLAVTSMMSVGCSDQPAANNNNPPPAATSGSAPAGSAPAAKGPSGAPVANGPAATTGPDGQPLPGLAAWKDKKNPVANNAQTLAQGKDIFMKNCATCHGNEGKGDGPAGLALDPKPRDFTSGQFQFGNEDWQVMRTVVEGIPPTGMAGWKGRMTDTESWTVVHYVKSLSGQK